MDSKDFNARLIKIINKSHRLESDYLNSVSEGERSATGTFTQWAPKDRISHITYWRRRTVESLSYLSRDQSPPEYPPYEECNRLNFDETKDHSLQMILRDADAVMNAIPLALQRFTEEDLRTAGRYPRDLKINLLEYVLSNCYFHPVYHISEGYLKVGNLTAINRVQDQMVTDMLSLDDNPRTRGTVYYDRACFYALTGNREAAYEYLLQSFGFRPELKKWAREDGDLASLHSDPQFLEITSD